MALLKITDASGRQWQHALSPQSVCTIGRAQDNSVVLDDPRASRYHAHIKHANDSYVIIDGRMEGAAIQRSSNKVLIDGKPFNEHALKDGERITIGASVLLFEAAPPAVAATRVGYDDARLGHTQVAIKAEDMLHTR